MRRALAAQNHQVARRTPAIRRLPSAADGGYLGIRGHTSHALRFAGRHHQRAGTLGIWWKLSPFTSQKAKGIFLLLRAVGAGPSWPAQSGLASVTVISSAIRARSSCPLRPWCDRYTRFWPSRVADLRNRYMSEILTAILGSAATLPLIFLPAATTVRTPSL